MTCPSCGAENRDGAKFCDNCGKPLAEEDAHSSQARPWFRTPMGIGALCAAVALLVVVVVVARLQPATSSSAVPQPASAATPATQEAAKDSNDVWAGNYIDKNGLPTVYAFSELYGWQLVSLLEQQDWMWDGDYSGWFNRGDTGALFVEGPNGALTDKTLQELGKMGAGVPVVYSVGFSSSLHGSLDDAMTDLLHVTLVDMEWAPKAIIALVYGQSSSEKSLVILTQNEAGDRSLTLFNPEAIAAGMVDKQLGGTHGVTAEKVFESLTGRAPNLLS